MTVGAITNYLRVKVGRGRVLVDTCIEVFAWGLICAGYYSHLFDVMPFYLHFVKMYPFFIMGTICYSHKRILTAIVSNEWLLAASVVIFIASFFCPSLPVKVGGFFAIIIMMNLFACYDKQLPAWLTTIGRYSLEIYVFHWFLLPQLSRCHNFFVGQAGETLDNGNFVIIFFISLAIALGIIAFCIAAGLVVKRSRILRSVLFGGY